MSDTPRTNLNHLTVETLRTLKGTGTKIVLADFARRLERELAAANERIRRLEEALDLCDSSFGRFCPLQGSRYGDCWEAVRAALGRPNPHPEEDKP